MQFIYGAFNIFMWPWSVVWGVPEAAIDATTINKRELIYHYKYDRKSPVFNQHFDYNSNNTQRYDYNRQHDDYSNQRYDYNRQYNGYNNQRYDNNRQYNDYNNQQYNNQHYDYNRQYNGYNNQRYDNSRQYYNYNYRHHDSDYSDYQYFNSNQQIENGDYSPFSIGQELIDKVDYKQRISSVFTCYSHKILILLFSEY